MLRSTSQDAAIDIETLPTVLTEEGPAVGAVSVAVAEDPAVGAADGLAIGEAVGGMPLPLGVDVNSGPPCPVDCGMGN